MMRTHSIATRIHGSGPTMLLVHGVGMCADYWLNIESVLAERFSIIAIDLPGHGKSDSLVSDRKVGEQTSYPPLAAYTDAIARLIEDQNHPVIVVGHSMGALIALDMAVRYEQLVSGVAVLNGIYRRSDDAQAVVHERVVQLHEALDTQTSKPHLDSASTTLARWFGTNPIGIEAESYDRCLDWLKKANPQGYAQAYSAFAYADAPTDAQLQAIKCPCLLMTGSLEPNSTPEMSEAMTYLIDGARCVIVENAKHMMSMTHGDEVSSAILEYFASKSESMERYND